MAAMSKYDSLSSEGEVSRRNGKIQKTDSDIRYDIHYSRRLVVPDGPSSFHVERWYPEGDPYTSDGYPFFQRGGKGEERSEG